MRQTLARLFDLALVTRPAPGVSCRIFEESVTPLRTWGARSSQYRAFFAKGAFGVVRVGGIATGADTLGLHYHIATHKNVYSGTATIGNIEVQFMALLDRIDTLD